MSIEAWNNSRNFPWTNWSPVNRVIPVGWVDDILNLSAGEILSRAKAKELDSSEALAVLSSRDYRWTGDNQIAFIRILNIPDALEAKRRGLLTPIQSDILEDLKMFKMP